MGEGDGIGRLGLAAGEAAGSRDKSSRSVALRKRCACNQRRLSLPSNPYRFWGTKFPHFQQKNFLVRPGPLFSVRAGRLLGLVPAGEELLRRLLVAPLHIAHVRNVFGVLVPVPK